MARSSDLVWGLVLTMATPAWAQEEFSFEDPGNLVPDSGEGRVDETIYVDGMRFPLESAPAFLNSQVWGNGGFEGPGGRECDEVNYSYPWRDNYCETRGWNMPLCPAGTGHQGQDIRPSTCEKDQHWVVAPVAGQVAHIGSYTVTLISEDGTEHRFLHMEPASLTVQVGSAVARGERLGRVSNAFVGRDGQRVPTTVHLHYDIQMNLDGQNVFVPPYMSLVQSYESLLQSPQTQCAPIPSAGRTIDDDEGCVELIGPAQYWRKEANEEATASSLHWTNAHSGANASNAARIALPFEEAGTYRVEVFMVSPRNQATQAPYVVHVDGTDVNVVLDQSAKTGWVELGEWAFAAGDSQWITVSDNANESGTNICLDAVRLTRTDVR